MKAKSVIAAATLPALIMLLALQAGAVEGTSRERYLELAEKAFELSKESCPKHVADWVTNFDPSTTWGYAPPGGPVWVAGLGASLYEITGEEKYAEEAVKWLSTQHKYKAVFPEEVRKTRPEYSRGLPTLTDFFHLSVFAEAFMRVRNSDSMTDEKRRRIVESIVESAEHVFSYPEWGPMNRAILRAEGLSLAAKALPDHEAAARWRKMAAVLASDSWGRWEEEDAQVYHPVWLHSLIRYADSIGDGTLFDRITTRYYFDYFVHLMAPNGSLPDFGDGRWNGSRCLYVACLERAAAEYKRPDLRWAAGRMLDAMVADSKGRIGSRWGLVFTDIYRWMDEDLEPAAPPVRSGEVLEDLVGKKIVFRSGWGPDDTYLMLNYRDEGPYARVPRDFLRHTIPVEEEKMHHGHSDENSICLLMHEGSVLLHDAGYRDRMPSGDWGAYREDYFHNRIVARKDKRDREQPLFEFMRNMGSYNPVATEKIDCFDFEHSDVSRTRLIDARTGYEWDRVIVNVREAPLFVVVDIVKILETDYYTFADLWHGQHVLAEGPHHRVIATDTIQNWEGGRDQALLVNFLHRGGGEIGTFPIMRHRQEEHAVYHALSSHLPAGRTIAFTTVLVPVKRGADVAPLVEAASLLDTDPAENGVGVRIALGGVTHTICVKTDLERDILTANVRPRYTFESGRVKYGPFETDASFLHAREEGGKLFYSAANMVKIVHDGKAIFEARPSTYGLEPDDLGTGYGPPKWRYWEDWAK